MTCTTLAILVLALAAVAIGLATVVVGLLVLAQDEEGRS